METRQKTPVLHLFHISRYLFSLVFIILTLAVHPTSSVQLTVNAGIPVTYVTEGKQNSPIELRCNYQADNQRAYQQKCNSNHKECARVVWLVSGLKGMAPDETDIIARASEGYVRDQYGSRFAIEKPDNLVVLGDIEHASINGTYSCRVEIDIDQPASAIGSFDLYVMIPPSAPRLSGTEKPVLEKPTTLTCSAAADPPATYTWFRNDELVTTNKLPEVIEAIGMNDNDPFENIKISEDTSQLTINNVKSTDAGSYHCIARNKANEEGIKSNTLRLSPSKFNMAYMLYAAGAVAGIGLIFVLLCCFCCKGDKNKMPEPNPLHSFGYDPKISQNVNYSSGRAAVTPARSQGPASYLGAVNSGNSGAGLIQSETMYGDSYQSTYNPNIIKNPYDHDEMMTSQPQNGTQLYSRSNADILPQKSYVNTKQSYGDYTGY